MKSILGKKIGMTQIFNEDGSVVPVTVIEAGPMVVTQIKTKEKEGYNAIQVGYIEKKEKHVNQPMRGHFGKAGVSFKKHLQEFKIGDDEQFNLGDEIKLDIFQDGDVVDVIGISKGKGTQGSIVRHNYSRGPMGHGSKSHRVAGARAAGSDPARVFKGRKGSGKMGNERVTIQNIEVVKVSVEDNYILVKGGVPGPKGGLVQIKQAIKA